jgi:hypothetical protein
MEIWKEEEEEKLPVKKEDWMMKTAREKNAATQTNCSIDALLFFRVLIFFYGWKIAESWRFSLFFVQLRIQRGNDSIARHQ